MSKENTKTEETARRRSDVAIITARLLVQVACDPRGSDAATVDAWCRIVTGTGVEYDPRPNFDAAMGIMQPDDADGGQS